MEHPDHNDDVAPVKAHAHKKHESHGHPDMDKELRDQMKHPFHTNPEQWLETHGKDLDACFDCSGEPVTEVTIVCIDERMTMALKTASGKRVLRMAGSGVLFSKALTEDEQIEELADSLAQYVAALAQASGIDVSSIKLKISSHLTCGAAAKKFGAESADPDESAREYQQKAVAALKARGINAEFTNDAPMNDNTAHNALATIVDFSRGRLQRTPITVENVDGMAQPMTLNTFVVSSPSDAKALEDALLSIGIASGSHSYGEQLKQYTFLVLIDPADPKRSWQFVSDLTAGAKPFEAKGIKVKIVTREAPKDEK